jgi:THO complex subunit 5
MAIDEPQSSVHDVDLLQVLDCIASLRQVSLSLLALQEENLALNLTQSPKSSLPAQDAALSQSQSQVFAHAARLRSLHRRAILTVRETKQDTTDARSEVDRLNLQLQNLVYEQRHLRGEITACEEYEYVAFSAAQPGVPRN